MSPLLCQVGILRRLTHDLCCQLLCTPLLLLEVFAGAIEFRGVHVLIVVGLVAAAITSPILDRTKAFLLAIKICVPVIAVCFVIFIWMPETRVLAGPYAVLAILGAACFSLVPVALELLIELSHPLSPEVTSTIAWAGGQLLSSIFVLVSDALVEGQDASPPKHMKRALTKILFFVCAFLVALASPLRLWAQTTTAELAGTVQDASGAAIPGALITAVDPDTNVPHSTKSEAY